MNRNLYCGFFLIIFVFSFGLVSAEGTSPVFTLNPISPISYYAGAGVQVKWTVKNPSGDRRLNFALADKSGKRILRVPAEEEILTLGPSGEKVFTLPPDLPTGSYTILLYVQRIPVTSGKTVTLRTKSFSVMGTADAREVGLDPSEMELCDILPGSANVMWLCSAGPLVYQVRAANITDPGIFHWQFRLGFDESKLKFKNIEFGGFFADASKVKAGKIMTVKSLRSGGDLLVGAVQVGEPQLIRGTTLATIYFNRQPGAAKDKISPPSLSRGDAKGRTYFIGPDSKEFEANIHD